MDWTEGAYMISSRVFLFVIGAISFLLLPVALVAAPNVTIYPAPAGESLSSEYTVQVQGRPVPVYVQKVAPGDSSRRLDAMDYSKNVIGHISDEAAFTYFDMQGTVDVSVSYNVTITAAKLLPDIPGARLVTNGKTVHFSLSQPRNFVLELNHDLVRTLQIFANPMETDAPSRTAPNVVYFGPGIHEVSKLTVGDGKTLYIAGGAIVRTVAGPGETYQTTARVGQRSYEPAITIQGSDIKVRGRGIIDGSMIPSGKKLLSIGGRNISIEGIILRDPSTWTMPLRKAEDVTITNVKILGYRLNSDGIDIVSSQNVTIQGCFIRTFDDLIVIKSVATDGPSTNIVAKQNTLWNEKGHAMTIGSEVQAEISNITFADNDVIRDLGHDWTMRVFLSGNGNVDGVHYQNIRVNLTCIEGMPEKQCPGLISLWIGKPSAASGGELGSIRNISFRNIEASSTSPKAPITFAGASETSDIQGVQLDNVVINGRPISKADIKENRSVRNVTIR
jgi:hypothetical protein